MSDKHVHLVSNPHNGSHVDAEGIKLAPGEAVVVRQEVANVLKQTFEFLAHSVVPASKAPKPGKVVKLSKPLKWAPVNKGTDELPEPDSVEHTGTATATTPARVRAPKAAAPAKKKPAKAKK